MTFYFHYLIIGGGISGITCVETLNQLDENLTIGLINCSDTVKSVTNLHRITKLIEDFNVVDKDFVDISNNNSRLFMIKGEAKYINSVEKFVKLSDGREIFFSKLCICTGAKPKLIYNNNAFIMGIRDTDSVEIFKAKLTGCKCVAIVGNGGIATELVYELADCELVWIIKDKNISATFFDSAAGKFLLNTLDDVQNDKKDAEKIASQRHHYDIDGKSYTTERKILEKDKSHFGGALGPDWARNMTMRGCGDKKLNIQYEAEIASIETEPGRVAEMWGNSNPTNQICDYKVALTLTNGSIEFCDLVISATGVTPEFPPLAEQKWPISDIDGGILVTENMETNIAGIYAAGDCCSAHWEFAEHWFQMRLWNQARLMGFQAAKSMFASQHNNPPPMLDFSFELFTHVTKFFGYSVILLGLYNGQKLQLENNENAELLIRTSPGLEYIKCVVVNGRIRGAVLIGDTEMAETLEDLILDQIDVSQYGEHLLDPTIDIVDYFD